MAAGALVGVGTWSLDVESFDLSMPLLLVDNLDSFKEGDGDSEREVSSCCVCGNDVLESESEEERAPSFGATVCIEVGIVGCDPVEPMSMLRSDDATLSAFKLAVERPDCSTSPASLVSDPRDAGRDTAFCGGFIVPLLSFHG
jgi:hypothetical protein